MATLVPHCGPLFPAAAGSAEPLAGSTTRHRAVRAAIHGLQPPLSGVLLAMSFPPIGFWPLSWVGLVPLLRFLAAESSWRRRVAGACLGGTVFAALGIGWLREMTTPGWVILSLYLGGLSWGIFALGASAALRTHRAFTRALLVPAAWVATEWVRGLLPGDLPWLYLGHAQAAWPPIVQLAEWTGVWGISFLVVLANVALAVGPRVGLVALALLAVAPRFEPAHVSRTIRAGIVQPGLTPDDKANPSRRESVVSRLRDLSSDVAEEADVILWPESSYPYALGQQPNDLLVLSDLVRTLGRPLVTGVVTSGDALYNSVLALDAAGEVTSVYDKRTLVPVSEYMPDWMRGTPLERLVTGATRLPHRYDFTPGVRPVTFELLGVPATVAICYEHAAFRHVREGIRAGGRLLLNVGNERAFDGTAEYEQALQISTFRAVEHRVPVVRAMNTGISGVITPDGRASTLPPGILSRVLDVPVTDGGPTLYTRLGDWLAHLCVALALGLPMLGWAPMKSRADPMVVPRAHGLVGSGEGEDRAAPRTGRRPSP